MTLISHRYKFIYIKTMKTASTSVQDFFRPYCMSPEGEKKYTSTKELKNQVVNEHGIMSMAGPWVELKSKGARWASHLGAETIKNYLNDMRLTDIFDNYYKFSIVRNPWDTIISRYFHTVPGSKSFPVEKVKAELSNFIKKYETPPYHTGVVEGIIDIKSPENLWMLTVNDELACDFYIRYEHLKDDIGKVCKELNIENTNLTKLAHFRNESRPRDENNYRKYYTDETKQLVSESYKDYIKYFSYGF